MKYIKITLPSFRSKPSAKGPKWEVNFHLEDESRRSRRSFKGGFPSKKAARQYYEAFREAVESGRAIEGDNATQLRPPQPDVTTLNQLLASYRTDGQSTKSPNTRSRAEFAFASMLRSIPGDTPLQHIDTRLIDSFIARRINTDRVSVGTVHSEISAIGALFSTAARWGMIDKSPVSEAQLPKLGQKKVVFLETHEQRSLLSATRTMGSANPHNSRTGVAYLRPLVAIAILTGLRKQELFHLQWQDIDFERRQLSVINRDEGEVGTKDHFETKNKQDRVVGLHLDAVAELKAWESWFAEEISRTRLLAAKHRFDKTRFDRAEERMRILIRCQPRPDRLVFPSFRLVDGDGEARPMGTVNKVIKKAFSKAGIERPGIGLHALRHTFAVNMIRSGCLLIHLQRLMGHADHKTTMQYLRFGPSEGARSVDLMPGISGANPAKIEEIASDSG